MNRQSGSCAIAIGTGADAISAWRMRSRCRSSSAVRLSIASKREVSGMARTGRTRFEPAHACGAPLGTKADPFGGCRGRRRRMTPNEPPYAAALVVSAPTIPAPAIHHVVAGDPNLPSDPTTCRPRTPGNSAPTTAGIFAAVGLRDPDESRLHRPEGGDCRRRRAFAFGNRGAPRFAVHRHLHAVAEREAAEDGGRSTCVPAGGCAAAAGGRRLPVRRGGAGWRWRCTASGCADAWPRWPPRPPDTPSARRAGIELDFGRSSPAAAARPGTTCPAPAARRSSRRRVSGRSPALSVLWLAVAFHDGSTGSSRGSEPSSSAKVHGVLRAVFAARTRATSAGVTNERGIAEAVADVRGDVGDPLIVLRAHRQHHLPE